MYFLCCKDRFGNLLDLIFWYSNAFVMNLVVSLKIEWPHPPRTCQNTDGWLLRYLAVGYKLHFPWYFTVIWTRNGKWMNLYLFPNKIPKNDNNKNNQWIILIFNQKLRRIASKKWSKKTTHSRSAHVDGFPTAFQVKSWPFRACPLRISVAPAVLVWRLRLGVSSVSPVVEAMVFLSKSHQFWA